MFIHLIQDIASDPLANVNKENTEILMYCTGGIRCDVYSTILRYVCVYVYMYVCLNNELCI